VFPVGMYTVATFIFAKATGLSFLTVISAGFSVRGVGGMGVTLIGMMRELASLFAARGNAITRRFLAIHRLTEKCRAEAFCE
jgi:hypothetical protein